MKNIKITGLGYYLPEHIETSEDLAHKLNKSADWIISRTGVKEKRISHHLDVDAMGEASLALIGHHDFSTFRSSKCQAKTPKKCHSGDRRRPAYR